MTRRNLRALAAIVVGLLLLLVVLDQNVDRDHPGSALLPGFAAHANDVTAIQIVTAGDEAPIELSREADRFVVATREGYPADIGKLRELVIALAEAQLVEDKTANPENYGKLGVDDPAEGGSGTKIVLSGPDFSYSVILGNAAQGEYRYARVVNEPRSYLIDQNPAVPADAAEWLAPEILDVGPDRVARVRISHADGESLVIEKSAQDSTDFTVLDVPGGRELSYASVGNGIGAALDGLELSDVRLPQGEGAATTVVFETFEGLTITAQVYADEDRHWVGFRAQPIDRPAPGIDDEASRDNEAVRMADEINDRLSGWQYRIPDFKTNLLMRRWDDILKAPDGE